MVSVIIPAFNEEKVISRCLNALIDYKQQLDIIVVCNGCTDNTAKVVQSNFLDVRVILVETASKVNAVNLGLKQCKYQQVMLVDADIIFPFSELNRLVRFAEERKLMVASPIADVELTNSSIFVRAFYKVALRLPYYTKLKISAVIYLSAEGRQKLGTLPDLISDDDYIRLSFSENQKKLVKELSYKLFAPIKYWGLIKILSRSHLGNKELKKRYAHLFLNQRQQPSYSLFKLAKNLLLWPSLIIFVGTKIIVRVRAYFQFKKLSRYQWEKDESSRVIK